MAVEQKTLYTYADLEKFPDDNLRREIIDGELIVTPSPRTRHQAVVLALGSALYQYCRGHEGAAFVAPLDVLFADDNVVEPDVLFIRHENRQRIKEKFIRAAPDIVVEVSSPSQRRLELVRKRELYERFAVPEYWYVDLDAERVEIYRLDEGVYGVPNMLVRGDDLISPLLQGFSISLDELFGEDEE